jgi:hypothetical protein
MRVFSGKEQAALLQEGGLFLYTCPHMALDWGQKRRVLIIGSVVALMLVILGSITAAALYEPPRCDDGKPNGDEAGVDCGGSCVRICTADVTGATVLFARAIPVPGGRVDAVAYVENRDRRAEADDAPYTIELFATDGAPLGSYQGTIDLPAGGIAPLFVPGIVRGEGAPRAFLSIGDAAWRRAEGALPSPTIGAVSLEGGDRPRAIAELRNEGAETLREQEVVAVVFEAGGQALGASATVVRGLRPGESARATFTWPAPVESSPARVEVRAVPVLP